MKLLTAQQTKWLDQETIRNEPISSINLMERASSLVFKELLKDFGNAQSFVVACGKGNNGGDGLVISRLLLNAGKDVLTFIPGDLSGATDDFLLNLEKLKSTHGFELKSLDDGFQNCNKEAICIDALIGTGLKSKLHAAVGSWIRAINNTFNTIVSVDINSGLPADLPIDYEIDGEEVIHSAITYCLEGPKFSLLFEEYGKYCESIKVIDIGLHAASREKIYADNYYLTDEEIKNLIPVRSRFSYKGTHGHVLVIAGSRSKTGAAFLCGKSAYEVGCGFVSFGTSAFCADKLQSSFPEAMTLPPLGENQIVDDVQDIEKWDVLAIGPGIGTQTQTRRVVNQIVSHWDKPIVIDADALNCIANLENFNWPENAIITPHPGEFDRLTQQHKNSYERFLSQRSFSVQNKVIVVLKGAYSSISFPDGRTFFNLSGTQAMAKAGSGDVLTGMIAGFLAQKLSPENAAILAVYLHGISGEIAASEKGLLSVNATDIIKNIHLSLRKYAN